MHGIVRKILVSVWHTFGLCHPYGRWIRFCYATECMKYILFVCPCILMVFIWFDCKSYLQQHIFKVFTESATKHTNLHRPRFSPVQRDFCQGELKISFAITASQLLNGFNINSKNTAEPNFELNCCRSSKQT